MRPPSNKTLTLLVLSLFFAVLIVRWLDPIRTTDMGSCLTQTLGRFQDIARTDFEIVSVSCDFIAKDESFTIFASRRGRTEKTPLFKYTPANVELPVISARDEHTVVISAWNVSSTFFS